MVIFGSLMAMNLFVVHGLKLWMFAKTKDHYESKLNAKGEILDVYCGCLVSYIIIPLSRQLMRNIQFLFILSSLANF